MVPPAAITPFNNINEDVESLGEGAPLISLRA